MSILEMNEETLYRFFKRITTAEEETEIRSWVEESLENKELFFEQRKLFDSLELLKDEKDLQAVFSGKNLTPAPKFPIFREILKIAAVVAVTFLSVWFIFQETQKDEFVGMQAITVPAGQRINITLPDGTNVWLNARTTIQYPITFNRKERYIKLDGQAYFDVMHNEDVPFIVETDKGNIEVLGTKFDVMAYAGVDQFETALMEGSVKVNLTSDPTQTLILKPDTKAYLDNGKLCQTTLSDYSTYRWKEGLISFENSSFSQIMKEFEKSYGIEIVIRNDEIQKYHYTGKFRITDGVDYALRVLQKDIRFTYQRDLENHIIYIK